MTAPGATAPPRACPLRPSSLRQLGLALRALIEHVYQTLSAMGG